MLIITFPSVSTWMRSTFFIKFAKLLVVIYLLLNDLVYSIMDKVVIISFFAMAIMKEFTGFSFVELR